MHGPYMSNIRNTEITGERGFRYIFYVATAIQNIKDFRNFSLWTFHIFNMDISRNQNKILVLGDFGMSV